MLEVCLRATLRVHGIVTGTAVALILHIFNKFCVFIIIMRFLYKVREVSKGRFYPPTRPPV